MRSNILNPLVFLVAGLFVLIHVNLSNPKKSFTDISLMNSSKDSVKVFLTLQEPNSVVGIFGIKSSDTTGSKSQGYFFAKKDVEYKLNYKSELFGLVISFEAPPMNCEQATSNGFKNGINVFEASINCDYESFDISCVDGVNSEIFVKVSDSNWTVGNSDNTQVFDSTKNSLNLSENINLKGVFPYRCTDCVEINNRDVPKNCFNIPEKCNEKRTCQVNRFKSSGGDIIVNYR